jgi:hypothetical protein
MYDHFDNLLSLLLLLLKARCLFPGFLTFNFPDPVNLFFKFKNVYRNLLFTDDLVFNLYFGPLVCAFIFLM